MVYDRVMDRAKLADRKHRISLLSEALRELYPHPAIELDFATPWQLLFAVIMSAQCTDKMVNKVTAGLFRTYPTLDAIVAAGATPEGIAAFEQAIKPTGFYHRKAQNVLACARMLKEKFGGEVPRTMAELLTLPGVARKTATVVLGAAYDVTAGVTVDTHVIRFVRRYDLSDSKNPERIEQDLMALLSREEWRDFALRATLYGRYLAPARPYDVTKDPLVRLYPPAAERFTA